MYLANRIAIVTGGAKGIGKSIAIKFAQEGCSVVIADILGEEGERTAREISAQGTRGLFIGCDVSNSNQVAKVTDETIREFGKVDILVNNAGMVPLPRSIVDRTEEEWDRMLNVNLKSVFLCSKAVVPHMKKQGYGKIINMSSVAAIAPPMPIIHYSASKAGVLGLTKDLALELAPFHICVNAILPGTIRTEMLDAIMPPGVDKDEFYMQLAKMVVPMQRMGEPEDVAGAALFLASELSDFVTGDRLIVGGGTPLLTFMK